MSFGISKIAVVGVQIDNRGDIVGARQLADAIQMTYQKVVVIFSYIVTPGEQVSLSPEEKKEFKIVPIESFKGKEKEFSKVVVFPSCPDILMPVWMRRWSIVSISEYGMILAESINYCKRRMGQNETKRLGLAKGDFGVFIPQDLYAHARVYYNAPASFRLTYLQNLPRKFVKSILGQEYSETAISAFVEQGWKLFSCYAHHADSIESFVSALTTTESCNLVVWILKPKMELNLKKFATLQIIYEKEGKVIAETTTNKSGSGRLKLIFCPLRWELAKNLYKATENKTLATGHNSFLENLMLNKHVCYEETHLFTVSFFNSFIEIAASVNIKFKELMMGQRKSISQPLGMQNFFRVMEAPDAQRGWERIIQTIHDKHNINDRIVEIVGLQVQRGL